MKMSFLDSVSPKLREDLLVAVDKHPDQSFLTHYPDICWSQLCKDGTAENVGVADLGRVSSLIEPREPVVLGKAFGLPLTLYYLSESVEAVKVILSRLRALEAH